jgi:hypothetical protein
MKIFVALFLSLGFNVCHANWVLIDKNSEYELYIFKPSISKTNQGFRLT